LAPPGNAGPVQIVTDLVGDVVGDDIEEVLAVDEIAERPADKVEIGFGAVIGGIGLNWHFGSLQRFQSASWCRHAS
jgi:hypothetical protein